MKINGIEFDFNIGIVSNIENYNRGLSVLDKANEEIQKYADGSPQIIATEIQAFKDFFYEATGVDVIYNVDDVSVAIDCYMEFFELVKAQKENIDKKLDAFKSVKPVELATDEPRSPEATAVMTTDKSPGPSVAMAMRPPKIPSDHMPKAKPGAPAPFMAAMRPPKTS